MRTIAIMNQKGGCGKTTVSINLASVLASRGQRTLLVDMDPQSHCSLGLAVPEAQVERSIGDLLRAGLDGSLTIPDITWQISRGFDLAPCTMALAGLEQELPAVHDKDRRLLQVLSTVCDQYDFCIIDCPPSIGLLTFNALRASDEVLIPVETGYFSMQGAVRQEATIQMLARRAGHRVRFSVLATMYDVRTRLAREILTELRRQFGPRLLPVVVYYNSKLKEAASFGQPINEYDPSSRGMQDFQKLTEWLLANPPAPAPVPTAASPTVRPTLDRAAELVERARALSARTAALAAKVATHSEVHSHGSAQAVVAQEPDEPTALDRKLERVYGVRQTSQGVLFLQPAPQAKQVNVAGDFNAWDPSATPMKLDQALGVWQACVPVPPGRYLYRLVIDGLWVNDPYNTRVETNGFGELNSVLEVGNGR